MNEILIHDAACKECGLLFLYSTRVPQLCPLCYIERSGASTTDERARVLSEYYSVDEQYGRQLSELRKAGIHLGVKPYNGKMHVDLGDGYISVEFYCKNWLPGDVWKDAKRISTAIKENETEEASK